MPSNYPMYDACSKIIESKAIFTKRGINQEGKVDFLQDTRRVKKLKRLNL